MNNLWQGIVQIVGVGVPIHVHPILAQATPTATPAQSAQPGIVENGADYLQTIVRNIAAFVPSLLAAILILVVGLIIAFIASAITKGILKRTNLDNKLADWLTGRQAGSEPPPVEQWVGSAVFWIVMIFTAVAVLDTLRLEVVSQPLNTFLNQILSFLPKLFAAGILLGIAWLIATLVKLVTTRALRALRLDERLGQQVRTTPDNPDEIPSRTTSQFSLADTIGNALYWFIFLLFLPAILSTLGLEGTLLPVQQLLNEILAILPNILAAIVIAAVGWLVAQVVRRIVTNLLSAAGADRLGSRFGLRATPGGQSLSWILGTVVYVLILIPTAIAALNALQIAAISAPAIAMLNQILSALPKIFTAGLILAIAYVLGHFLSDLVTNILTSIGFNNIFQWIGLPSPRSARRAPGARDDLGFPPAPPTTGTEPRLQTTPVPTRTPSELVGIIVLVGVMLFATVAAVDVLEIEALTAIVSGIVVIAGRILAGLIVFAIGLYLANLAFNLIISSGSRQSKFLAQAARIAIIALVLPMALQQMGIAGDIVNLAFGLLLGAIAVAIALAFGLGGRDIAAGQVREWLDSFKQNRPPDIR
ncbi:MAG: mechanosensitive ion channel [Microcoleus sp. SIO2G3]|nr:mechanosensitive ion channel [Microcoleus sp. SIO2G3]